MASVRLWQSFARLKVLQPYTYRTPFACRRSMSDVSVADFDLSRDEDTGIAILRMQKKPVNSLSLKTITDMNISLDKLEQDDRINGLIITSVIPKIFSGGLELNELYQPQKETLKEFWRVFHEFWLKLYSSRLVTVAAINGHAIAGGCVIALCCDYRIMASSPYKIGLNETQLGLQAPTCILDSMVNVVGQKNAERALKLGQLFLPAEALKVGLVDEVVADDAVLESARREVKKWLQVPGHARQLTKEALRKPTVDRMMARANESVDFMCDMLAEDVTQKILGNYFASLKKKEK